MKRTAPRFSGDIVTLRNGVSIVASNTIDPTRLQDGSVRDQHFADKVVSNRALSEMPPFTIKANPTNTSRAPRDVTPAQLQSFLIYNAAAITYDDAVAGVGATNVQDALVAINDRINYLIIGGAELLDGEEGAFYLDWTNTTNKPSPVITVNLTGDVTGSASATFVELNSGTVNLTTSVAVQSKDFGTFLTSNTDSGFNWTPDGSAVADSVADTLTLVAGAAIALAVDPASDAIRITNTGVTSLSGTANQIEVSSSTGSVTLTTPQDIHTEATPTFAGLTANGNILVDGGDVDITGTLTATAKSFLITHPSNPTKMLQYGSLEGPEHGVYVRGKVDGASYVLFPDYWVDLVDEKSITVQVTAIGVPVCLYVAGVTVRGARIMSDRHMDDISYYFTATATRKDISPLQVELDNTTR